MNNLQSFKESLLVSDQLLKIASKEDIAECARLLALNVAHYQSVYGELDLDETLKIAYSDKPNDDQLLLIVKGLETLIGVLGGIVQGFEDKTNH